VKKTVKAWAAEYSDVSGNRYLVIKERPGLFDLEGFVKAFPITYSYTVPRSEREKVERK